MTRRVVILRDPQAPLHYLRCASPCQPQGWCMDMEGTPGCYLAGAMCEAGARVIAERAGYSVVPAP